MNFLLLILSLLCYYTAPRDYSQSFILLLFVFFCIQTLLYIRKNKHEQLINFHVIFLASSFIVVYIYPLLIHPIGISFIRGLCADYINKGTALAQVCLSGFLYGVSLIRKNKKVRSRKNVRYPTNGLTFMLSCCILCICVYYVPLIGGVYGALQKQDTLSSIILLLFTIYILLNINNERHEISDFKDYFLLNKKALFPIIVYCAVLLFVGIRFAVLSILLVSLISYISYSKKINYKLIILSGLTVLLLFFIIVVTRNGGELNEYNNNIDGGIPKVFYMFSDLIGISNNLYAGVEYVERYGIINGSSIIPQIFAPIPYIPTFLTQLMYGTNTTMQTTQYILSDYLGTVSVEHTYFVGTNCFIDIYMNCGMFITVVAFIVFGGFTQKIMLNRFSNIYYQFIYFILVSEAIFMTRGTIYSCYRPIIWGIIIVYFLSHLKLRNSKVLAPRFL